MTANQTTAVGVFPDLSQAEYAVAELRRNGFGPEQIGFVVPDAAKEIEVPIDTGTMVGEGTTAGAAVGVTLGALLGVALSNFILPGVGPVIVGGLLAGVFGAAVGAAGGGVLGALIGMNIPEEEARLYEKEFHSGRTLVTVRADDRYEEAVAILAARSRTSLNDMSTAWDDWQGWKRGETTRRAEEAPTCPGLDSGGR